MPQLSVIIPVYNEATTIRQIIEKVNRLSIDKEIIVIDNNSSDGTIEVLKQIEYHNLRVIYQSRNRGKGTSVRTGLRHAAGDFAIIQDADLEYDPGDYLKLLEAQEVTKADLVLGARFTKGYRGSFIPRFGNRFVTALFNLLFQQDINDCLTCYKLFRPSAIKNLKLISSGFDIEIEIITKAVINKLNISEVPVSYRPRSYASGKKIRWRDGIWAIASIIKYKLYQKKNAKLS